MGTLRSIGWMVATVASLTPFFLETGCAQGPETKIQIVTAIYGYATNRKDVKDDVAKFCDGRSSCHFIAANETFSSHAPLDPSPGDDKRVIYTWKCGEAVHKEATAEGRKAMLSCGQRVANNEFGPVNGAANRYRGS